MKRQGIGMTAVFAFLATLTIGDIRSIANSKSNISEGVVLAQTSDARKAEAYRLLQQGIQQGRASQFEAALQSWQQALIIYKEIGDRSGEAAALLLQGSTYLTLGDLRRARELLEQSLTIARTINDSRIEKIAREVLSQVSSPNNFRQAEADRLFQQGIQQYQTNQFSAALQSWQQALIIYREIKDRKKEGNTLGNLGNAYDSLGDYPQAIAYFQQRLVIARELKDRQGEAAGLRSLGTAYVSLGDYANAIANLERSLTLAKALKDRQGEGIALGNLGVTYLFLGDYPKAIEYYQQHLTIVRELKHRQGEGIVLGNLGNAYRNLGDYPKAIAYNQQRLAIARELKDRQGEGQSLGSLGNAYYSLGDYQKAIEYHQQHLAIARAIEDREGEANALGNLGNAYGSVRDYPNAIEYHQQNLAIVRSIKNQLGEGKALNNLGLALFKSGNLTAAETTLNQAIEVYESLRNRLTDAQKVSIFDTQSNSYRTLQQVLIAQNKIDVALEISEAGRARAFVELLTKKLTANAQQNLPTTLLKPTINQLKQIAKQQNTTLVQYSIVLDEFPIQNKQEWKQSELYIWVIKPTGEVTFRRSDLKPLWQKQNITLANLVTTSRESLGVRGRGGLAVTARVEGVNQTEKLQQLYQLLIQPIADLLPSDPNARVTFIPQSELFLVPFPALQDPQKKYLIEKHTILTAPSIQVLDLTRQQRQLVSGKDILIVGNPNMPSIAPKLGELPQKLPSLPGAETEAKSIAQLLNAKAITGNDATKSAILPLLPKAKIIHFATHGLLDDFTGLGMPGAIALAPSGKDNGLLTASEILDLKLQAELVVLSACDTGRGKVTGDGVIGLSRSLISAGVPSVIVSLWAVPDAPTATLMTQFYQNLSKNPDKAQALRQAMLTTMKNHSHPKDWAAFTLIGEAE